MRLWDRKDEWVGLAPCADSTDFVIAPEDLGPQRTAAVQRTCAGCPVRPECIEMNCAPVTDIMLRGTRPSNSIWVAGVWLPDVFTAASRRELEAKRQGLLDSLPFEHALRSDEVL